MDSDKGYSIVIPEGAVIALDGNPVVNKRYVIDVNSSTGVENALINENDTPKQLYDLTGRKVYTPAPGQIYIMNGKKILIK